MRKLIHEGLDDCSAKAASALESTRQPASSNAAASSACSPCSTATRSFGQASSASASTWPFRRPARPHLRHRQVAAIH